jgi:hypothetical protein
VPLRIDHRERTGQLDIRFVVVGDDEIQAKLPRPAGRLHAADAAVHGDDEPRPVRVKPLDRGRLQTVSVAHPLGDEVHHVGAGKFERPAEDDGRGDAVHVVVTVHGNPLAPGNRRQDALDGVVHAGEAERVMEVVERRREEPAGGVEIAQAADGEQPRGDRRNPELTLEHGGLRVVVRARLPDPAGHASAMPTSPMARHF